MRAAALRDDGDQGPPVLGIRVALGASWLDTLMLVVGHGMLLTLVGVAMGIVGSVGMAKAMAGLLYGVSAVDPDDFQRDSDSVEFGLACGVLRPGSTRL